MNKQKITIRAIDGQYNIRKEENGKTYIDFYASVFNQRSKLIKEWGEVFFEKITPTAFLNVLADPGLNTIATVDHDRKKMIGRNKSKTLTMVTDSYGLKATVDVPDTTVGRDLLILIDRGDYFECSFIYTVSETGIQWDRSGEIPERTITNVDQLIDVSIVIDGAFSNTEIKKRYLSTDFENEEKPEPENPVQNNPNDILQKQIEIFNLKL